MARAEEAPHQQELWKDPECSVYHTIYEDYTYYTVTFFDITYGLSISR